MNDAQYPSDGDAANGTSADATSPADASNISLHPDPYEGAVPPGYDWPTHGGYLGCLIGLMASCLIGGFVATLVGLYTYYHQITGLANVIVLVAIFALATVICTNLGWRLGRRFFREYAQQPTWGESDAPDQTPAVATPDGSQASHGDVTADDPN